jgi:hypothetical protein
VVAKPQLVCPAGSLAALKAAVDNGADDVYLGFRNDTNARNFAGLNFDDKSLVEGIRYAHQRGRKVLAAINTYAQDGRFADWTRSVDTAAKLGIDAVIIADPGVLDYAAQTYPDMRRHLSVQASATSYEAVNFCREKFGIQRAVMPRVLTLAQVENVIRNTEVEIEVFGFGSLCVMNEGRCWLSSYATGESPNTVGACSPAKFVQWEKKPHRNGCALERHPHRPLRQRREGRLPDDLQGPLRSRGRDLLRDGRTGQPQRAGNVAGDHQDRGRRNQGRGSSAQPDLCCAGDPQSASGAGRRLRRAGKVRGETRLGGGAGQGLGRLADHAWRLQQAVAVKT